MKTRFWQKTYLWTLLLFLISLNVGIFGLSYYTYRENVTAAEKASTSGANYALQSLERDLSDMSSYNSPGTLMNSYGIYYGKRDALVALYDAEGEKIYSAFPEGFETEKGKLTHKQINGERYIVISKETKVGYGFIYAENASYLDRDFERITRMFTATSVGVSALLAVALYFVLKKLSVPFDRLRATTEKISEGDFSEKADESGDDEFSSLAHSFNIMLDRINAQLVSLEAEAIKKQSLVNNMAHELRTPLTGIGGYAEYIRMANISDEERATATEYIINECHRLKSLSEKLLDMASLTAEGLERENVDLLSVATQAVRSLDFKAKANGVTLTAVGIPTTVSGDAVLLGTLMYNLTDNAIKACTDGGRVTVAVSENGFAVTDNGKGMEKSQLARITEPFYRTDKSRSRKEGGTGLGLALCDTIAKSHGATLSFESELGKGTTARVDFTI